MTPAVSAMTMALIGRLIASVRVVFGDIMSTEHLPSANRELFPCGRL
jgi:hypothetical protein